MYYQGEPGAFSEAAIRHYFPEATPAGLPSFAAVYGRLRQEPEQVALLPIENAYRGPVTEVWDRLIEDEDLKIWAEVVEPVHLALIAHPSETLETIKRVRSHPQALMQSRGFWEVKGYEAEPALDTAGSVRELADFAWPGVGAIASPLAADRYGLQILATPIEDYPDNRTRFWLMSRGPVAVPKSDIGGYKATMAFDIPHRPGSLAEVLMVFRERQLDLSKIESRPRPGFPFEFRFWIDITLSEEQREGFLTAVQEVRGLVIFLRLLGPYPLL